MSLVFLNGGSRSVISVRDLSKIPLDLTTGPWIAGGAALSAWTGDIVNDVDVYFPHEIGHDATLAVLREVREITFVSDNATTLKRDNAITIQLIKQPHVNIKSVLDSFDFTVCQIATDGAGNFVGTAQAFADIAEKRLRVNKFVKEKFLSRWAKYNLYGYAMPPAEFKKYAQQCTATEFENIDKFDGNY